MKEAFVQRVRKYAREARRPFEEEDLKFDREAVGRMLAFLDQTLGLLKEEIG